MNKIENVNFFTAIHYGNGPRGKIDSLIEILDDYFFWGNHKAVVIPGKVIQNMQVVELKLLPPAKYDLCTVILKIIKAISYIPFGLLGLLLKGILRCNRRFIFIPPPPNDTNNLSPTFSKPPNPLLSAKVSPERFVGDKITAENFPFERPLMVSWDQLSSLQIHEWGEVHGDSTFKDSRFECHWVNENGEKVKWYRNPLAILTRHKFESVKTDLPFLGDNTRSLPFEIHSTALYQELQRKETHMYALDRVPDILNSGFVHQVYEVEVNQKERAVFKLQYGHVNLRMCQKFYPLRCASEDRLHCKFIGPQSQQQMNLSCNEALSVAEAFKKLPPSPYTPKFYGIVYVKEFNLWSPLYERIEGTHLPKTFATMQKAKQIMREVVQGLKMLDEHGYAQTDLKRSNIILRKDNEIPVLVDDPAEGQGRNNQEQSMRSRKQFGTLLYNALTGSTSPFMNDSFSIEVPKETWINENWQGMEKSIGKAMTQLICDCWSDKSMQEVGWDHILKAISFET